jgi:HK97 family phage portal protein
MGFLDRFIPRAMTPAPVRMEPVVSQTALAPQASYPAPETGQFSSFDDPAFKEWMKNSIAMGGFPADVAHLRNMAVLRAADLISGAIGALPLELLATDDSKAVQVNRKAHRLLRTKPNSYQTPQEFKRLLTLRCVIHGQAFARVFRSPIDDQPIAIVPLAEATPRPLAGYDLEYSAVDEWGRSFVLPARDVLHLRDITLDSINGISRLRIGREALDLARDQKRAAARLFKTGVMSGGAIEFEKELSDKAYGRLKESINEDQSGSENAGNWMLLEEGGKAKQFTSTAQSSQAIEQMEHQVAEVARMYGIPRPLMMMDSTAWGTGISALSVGFVQFGLSHWFKVWEESLARCMLDESELDRYGYAFDEAQLLRGTLAEQADFYAKALGAGGARGFMSQNEVRRAINLPRSSDSDSDSLKNPQTQKTDNTPKESK